MLADQNVLVTGGAGFVGRTLIPYLLELDPKVIRVFDQNESSLANMKQSLDDDRCRFLTGNVRDKERIRHAIKDIDIVIHTAAMKHVALSEYSPFEVVKTNVIGLQNVIDAAINSTVNRFVFTSSDKAVNPANTMGTTKLLGEKLVTAGNVVNDRADLKLACVRLGNVFNSSGSVVPIFRRQIREGGPVTLTDHRMTRFFLDNESLVDVVTNAIELTEGGEIFIAKMQAIRIRDLAEVMVENLAPEYGCDPNEITIEETGRRIGETFHEQLMTAREARRTVENDDLYAVLPETVGDGYLNHDGLAGFDSAEDLVRSSEEAETLEQQEVANLLDRIELLLEET